MPGAILSFNVIHVDSVVIINCVIKKVNNQVKGKIRNFKDQRTKKAGNSYGGCETREVAYTRRYTSGHVISNSAMY